MPIAFTRIRNEYTDTRLVEEGFSLVYYDQMSFRNGLPIHAEHDIMGDDCWYFRGIGSARDKVRRLVSVGKEHDKIIIDDYLLTDGPGNRTKMVHYNKLVDLVNIPHTVLLPNLDAVARHLRDTNFENKIVKFNRNGREGHGTFLVKSHQDVQEIRNILEHRKENGSKFTGSGTDWLVQDYIQNDGDYRALVVDGRCIGGFKRRPKAEQIVLNRSCGKSRRFVDNKFPRDIARLAEVVSGLLGITVCTLDIVRDLDTGRPFVIEANETPGIRVFEKRVKVNVMREVFNALEIRRRSRG